LLCWFKHCRAFLGCEVVRAHYRVDVAFQGLIYVKLWESLEIVQVKLVLLLLRDL
jgi:hypothetical protein